MKTGIQSILIVMTLLFLGLLPQVHAVSPAPDGCYPGFTTAEGCNALNSLTTGAGNTGLGWRSLFLDSTGSFNTAVGAGTLVLNAADSNTAVGAAALLLNTTGTENTAVGTAALVFNDSGNFNNAVGTFALFNNIDGSGNNAFGNAALRENIHAGGNTAIGDRALMNNNITGAGFGIDGVANGNTAVGAEALLSNTDGDSNTAVGSQALMSNTIGGANTAVGAQALSQATGGSHTALGAFAGANVTTASGVICIGSFGANVSNSCFIGHIRNVGTAQNNAIPVLIDSAGQLGTVSSSRRYKKEIKSMDKTSEAILALKPVTFHYKSDSTNRPEFGLIAEEVAEISPDLVVRDENGQIYTVRYDAVNAMLLNEFLKEHKAFLEEKRKVQELEANAARQQKQIEVLTAGLEKVSAQLELSKSARQTVLNNF